MYLALVSIEESGSAEHTGYGGYNHWDDDDDEFEDNNSGSNEE